MSDNLKLKSFRDELPENGQNIVYTLGELPGCIMCTFRFELIRDAGNVFNYTAILRLVSSAYTIQILPEDIDKFKWSAVNE